ncbi:MAG: transcriptional repressor [Candidatus Doudnabacteria bacterium]
MNFTQTLKENQFKVTPSRLEALEVLSLSKTPMTIEQIWQKLVKSQPNLVTVYRIIKDFKQKDLVRQVDLQHQHAHFELSAKDDHHHLVCTQCGRLEDVPGCQLNDLVMQSVRRSSNFTSTSGHNFEIFGLCKDCVRK